MKVLTKLEFTNQLCFLILLILIFNNGSLAETVPLKVAAVCMNVVPDKQANLQKMFSYMEQASAKGAHLIVFPEIALQQSPGWGNLGYVPTAEEKDYTFNTAETIPGESTEIMVKKAKELNLYVVVGMAEKVFESDVLYNSGVLLGPSGVIGKRRKAYLWDPATSGNEHLIFQRGNEFNVIDSPIGKIGLIICVEMYYMTGLKFVREGADILVTIAAWSSNFGGLYDSYANENAAQSQRWHVVSNQVGNVGHYQAYGHSKIIDPTGRVVVDTGPTEGMVVAQTDLMIEVLDLTSVEVLNSTVATWGSLKVNCRK